MPRPAHNGHAKHIPSPTEYGPPGIVIGYVRKRSALDDNPPLHNLAPALAWGLLGLLAVVVLFRSWLRRRTRAFKSSDGSAVKLAATMYPISWEVILFNTKSFTHPVLILASLHPHVVAKDAEYIFLDIDR
ncbi:hypothetical protein EDD18DRAFT_1109087 [Armillaria luteobubalina]|uniref:Uncharacterized protein n=1 Tax=Armillaria luteobubalina TaxID=153913 RepID=A0AA39PXF7_9AGAR|nr:hypothetical protein EDD18DRAFT_1109087 [Armillaria luteobubalina]